MKALILCSAVMFFSISALADNSTDRSLGRRRDESLTRLNRFVESDRAVPKVKNILGRVRDYISSATYEDLKQIKVIHAEALPHGSGVRILVYWVGDRLRADKVLVKHPSEGVVTASIIEYPDDDFIKKAELTGIDVGAMFSVPESEISRIKRWLTESGAELIVALDRGVDPKTSYLDY